MIKGHQLARCLILQDRGKRKDIPKKPGTFSATASKRVGYQKSFHFFIKRSDPVDNDICVRERAVYAEIYCHFFNGQRLYKNPDRMCMRWVRWQWQPSYYLMADIADAFPVFRKFVRKPEESHVQFGSYRFFTLLTSFSAEYGSGGSRFFTSVMRKWRWNKIIELRL